MHSVWFSRQVADQCVLLGVVLQRHVKYLI